MRRVCRYLFIWYPALAREIYQIREAGTVRKRNSHKTISVLVAFVSAIALILIPPAHQAKAAEASIEIDLGKITFLVGGTGGYGTLYYGDRTYPLTIGGVTAGATISFSRANLVGEVFNLHHPSEIEGIYTAGTAGLAAAGGAAVVQLTNSRGVMIALSGRQLGLDASLDLSGMKIWIR